MKQIFSVLFVISVGVAAYYFYKLSRPPVTTLQKPNSLCQLVAPHETFLNLCSDLISKEETPFSVQSYFTFQSVKLKSGKTLRITTSNCNGFRREIDLSPYESTSVDAKVVSELEGVLGSDLFNERGNVFARTMKFQLKSINQTGEMAKFTGKCVPGSFCYIQMTNGHLLIGYIQIFPEIQLKKIMATMAERQKSKAKN
jgi:hypothetical protein